MYWCNFTLFNTYMLYWFTPWTKNVSSFTVFVIFLQFYTSFISEIYILDISTESILRTHKATTPSVPSSKNTKSKKNSKQSTKQKQTNKHYNFHVYTASNYRKEPPVRNHPATLDTTESDSRISRDKKQRSSFEVCVNQQQFLLQLQVS